MSTRYKGSLMSSTAAATSTLTAPGIWRSNEVMQAIVGNWPLTAVDPYWSSVTLLLHGDGTNGAQNNTFLDSSTNAFTITRNGNTTQGAATPFTSPPYSTSSNGGSGYFDGAGDYLSAPANAAFAFGTAAWTVEAWVYVLTLQTITLFDTRSSASTSGIGCTIGSDGKLYYSGSANTVLTTTAISASTWTHVAWVYNGTTLTGYIDGVSGGTAIPLFNITQNNCYVGQSYASASLMQGYVSNLRVVKGTAVYTSNFATPTAPVTAITGTSLLLNFTNGGIYDNAMKNDLETISTVQASTTTYKFGTASIKFNGTSDCLITGYNPINSFGTSDFTIEMWLYISSGVNYQFIMGSTATGGMMIGLNVPISGTPSIAIGQHNVAWVLNFGSSISFASNTWTHIAITRSGSTNRAFINGVQLGSNITDSTSWSFSNNTPYIGTNALTNFYGGYMDDIRITNGVARYTANFTPPTAAFPNQ